MPDNFDFPGLNLKWGQVGGGDLYDKFPNPKVKTISGPLTHVMWNYPDHNTTTNISRIADRLLVGGAVVNDGDRYLTGPFSFTNLDWLGALSKISIGGGDGVGLGGDGNCSQAYILTDPDSDNSYLGTPNIALTVGAESSHSLTGSTPRALNIIGVNDPPIGQFPAVWSTYIEIHRLKAYANNSYGIELEVRESGSSSTWNPYNYPGGGGSIGLALGSGAGLNATGQLNSTAAIYITANPTQFNSGIIFFPDSISANGPGGSRQAIQMPVDHSIQFWRNIAGVGTLSSSIVGDTFDNLYLQTQGGGAIIINNGLQTNDNTNLVFGVGRTSFFNGSSASNYILAGIAGAERFRIDASGVKISGALSHNNPTMIFTSVALANGAAAAVGTLNNSPTAGDPTKWIPINDNGTTRYIPSW